MLELIAPLVIANTTKIVVLSLDGLAGLPRPETGRSELETASLPNLGALAAESACGLIRHVAARGNFCTVDREGRITDRRAGRIATELCVKLTARLRGIRLPGVEVFVEPVKEHRFVLVLRGRGKAGGLSGRLSETDPQQLGRPPLPVR